MHKEYSHGLTSWISGSAASASLALFVFIPSVEGLDVLYKNMALSLFVFSLPLLTASAFMCQEIKATNSASKKQEKTIGLFFILGSFAFLFGFFSLCMAINTYLSFALLGSLFVIITAFRFLKDQDS